MTAPPDFIALADRLVALSADLAAASEHGPDETACHILRLKALTLEHYATDLRLLGERLADAGALDG